MQFVEIVNAYVFIYGVSRYIESEFCIQPSESFCDSYDRIDLCIRLLCNTGDDDLVEVWS